MVIPTYPSVNSQMEHPMTPKELEKNGKGESKNRRTWTMDENDSIHQPDTVW